MAADLKAQVASLLGSGSERRSPTSRSPTGRSPTKSPTKELDPPTDLSLDSLRALVEMNHMKVAEIFKAWDKDKNGKVSKAEFKKAMTALGYQATQQQTDAIFDKVDKDHNGSINLKELITALKTSKAAKASAAAASKTGGLVRHDPSAKELLQTKKDLQLEQKRHEADAAQKTQALDLLQKTSSQLDESTRALEEERREKLANEHALEEERREKLAKEHALEEERRAHLEKERSLAETTRALHDANAQAGEANAKLEDLRESLDREVKLREEQEALKAAAQAETRDVSQQRDELNDELRCAPAMGSDHPKPDPTPHTTPQPSASAPTSPPLPPLPTETKQAGAARRHAMGAPRDPMGGGRRRETGDDRRARREGKQSREARGGSRGEAGGGGRGGRGEARARAARAAGERSADAGCVGQGARRARRASCKA